MHWGPEIYGHWIFLVILSIQHSILEFNSNLMYKFKMQLILYLHANVVNNVPWVSVDCASQHVFLTKCNPWINFPHFTPVLLFTFKCLMNLS